MDHLSKYVVAAFLALALGCAVVEFLKFRRRRTLALADEVKSSRLRGWTALAAALIVWPLVSMLGSMAATDVIRVDVDMAVWGGSWADLFVSDFNSPLRANIYNPGVRQIYSFTTLAKPVTVMRLDPTNHAGVKAFVYGIAIYDRGRLVKRIDADELKQWATESLTRGPALDALEMTSLTVDPTIFSGGRLHVPVRPARFLAVVGSRLFAAGSFAVRLSVLFLAVLALGIMTRRGRMDVVLAGFVMTVGYAAAWLAFRPGWPPPPVEAAVGVSAFNGYPKFRDHLSWGAPFVVAVLAGFLFSRWVKLRTQESPQVPSRRTVALLAHAVVLLAVIAIFQPPLSALLQQQENLTLNRLDWDRQNNFYWHFLVHEGKLPYRDFWYPYAGLFMQFLPFPWGDLAMWVEMSGTLALLYLGCFRVSGRRVLRALALYGVLFLPAAYGELDTWYRYLLPLNIVLAYAGFQSRELRTRFDWFLFPLTVAFAALWEPVQAVYGLVGVAAHMAAASFAGLVFETSYRAYARRYAASLWLRVRPVLIATAAGAVPPLAFYAFTGMLPGLIAFHSDLGVMSTYTSVWMTPPDWFFPAIHPTYIFVILFILAAVAAYRAFAGDNMEAPLNAALMAAVVTGFLVTNKVISRPYGAEQMFAYPYAAAVLYVASIWRRSNLAQCAVAGAFAGTLLGVYGYIGYLATLKTILVASPPWVVENARLLSGNQTARIQRLNAAAFDRTRFSGFDSELAVLETLKTDFGFTPATGRIFVLGDNHIFYILMRQEAPYVTNVYNASPIHEQRRILAWLESRRPAFVVWNPAESGFDGTPNVVRLPLVYQYIVRNYAPAKIIEPYHILRRADAATVDSSTPYWRKTLGTVVDLAYVPAACDGDEYSECAAGENACDTVLHVRLREVPAADRETHITLETPDGPYVLRMKITRHRREYIVNLNRLWFWTPEHSALSATVAPALDAGIEAALERRRTDRDVLF